MFRQQLWFIIPPHNKVVGGYIGFTPSVRPASHVRSVAPTVLVGSISYLYILSSNFRRCVACQVASKIWIFGIFLKFVTLTLSCFDLGLMWITSMGNHGAAGVSQNAGVLVLVYINPSCKGSGIFYTNWASIIPSHTLASCITMSSASMIQSSATITLR